MLPEYLKKKRKSLNLTQEDLALKAGIGLRVLREMEQGKPTLRMDKVNQVLMLFGAELGAVSKVKKDE
jgi:y4mF family transcriptional regulator